MAFPVQLGLATDAIPAMATWDTFDGTTFVASWTRLPTDSKPVPIAALLLRAILLQFCGPAVGSAAPVNSPDTRLEVLLLHFFSNFHWSLAFGADQSILHTL